MRRHGLYLNARRVLPRAPRRHAALARRRARRAGRTSVGEYLEAERRGRAHSTRAYYRELRRSRGSASATELLRAARGASRRTARRSPRTARPQRARRCSTTSGSAPISSTSSSTATCTSRDCTCPACTCRSWARARSLETTARLRAAARLELQRTRSLAQQAEYLRRGGRFIVPVPTPASYERPRTELRDLPVDTELRARPVAPEAWRSSTSRRASPRTAASARRAATRRSRSRRVACGSGFCAALRLHHERGATTRRSTSYSSTTRRRRASRRASARSCADLAQRWVDRYDLRGKTVLEIGCGKGEFLVAMLELGDRARDRHRPGDRARTHRQRRRPTASSSSPTSTPSATRTSTADAVVCRHTLEHIAPVADVHRPDQASGRRTAGSVVLFELPDVHAGAARSARSGTSTTSTARTSRRARSPPVPRDRLRGARARARLRRPVHRCSRPGSAIPRTAASRSRTRSRRSPQQLLGTGRIRSDAASGGGESSRRGGRGGRAVIWGRGSKGVAFLTTLGISDEISYAVDINPYKQGKFMAGDGTGDRRARVPARVPARPRRRDESDLLRRDRAGARAPGRGRAHTGRLRAESIRQRCRRRRSRARARVRGAACRRVQTVPTTT